MFFLLVTQTLHCKTITKNKLHKYSKSNSIFSGQGEGWEIYRTPNNWIHTGWINQGIKDCTVNLLHEHCMHVKKEEGKKECIILICINFVPEHDQFLRSEDWVTPALCSSCLRQGYLFQLTGAQGSRDTEKKNKGNRTESERTEGEREGRDRDDFANVKHKIHTFVGNSCNWRLTEKLEIKFHQLAP